MRKFLHDIIFKITADYMGRVLPRKYLGSIKGLEHLPAKGPYIIVANHLSFFDHLLLGALYAAVYREKIYFLTKKESFSTYWSRLWHDATGAVPVDREGPTKEQYKKILDLVRNKKIVVIYPEGTRSRDGVLLPFKKGAFKIAARMRVPIIPAGLKGTNHVLPVGSKWFQKGKASVEFGPALSQELITDKDIDGLMDEARDKITRMVYENSDYDKERAGRNRAAAAVSLVAENVMEEAMAKGSGKVKPVILKKVQLILEYAAVLDTHCLEFKLAQARLYGLKALKLPFPLSLIYLPKLKRLANKILLSDPVHPYGHYLKGNILFKIPALFGGDARRALKHLSKAYQQAAEYDMKQHRFGLIYAKALIRNNRKEEAISVLHNTVDACDVEKERGQLRIRKARALIGQIS